MTPMLSPAEPRAEGPPPPPAPLAGRPTFDEVYEEQFSFVWRSARGLGIPEHAVDDVTQEIFVIVHRRLADFEGRSSVRTWLYGILRNVVRSHRRDLRKRSTGEAPGEVAIDPDTLGDEGERGPDEAAAKAEAARLVVTLLEALDDDKREVFVLAELEQLTAPEIAQMLGEKTNTVYSRLRFAREEFAAAALRHRRHDEWRVK